MRNYTEETGEREKEGDFSRKIPLLLVFRARAENFTSTPQKLLKGKKKGCPHKVFADFMA